MTKEEILKKLAEIDTDVLDEMVIELKSSEASSINNGGPDEQASFIYESLGQAGAEKYVIEYEVVGKDEIAEAEDESEDDEDSDEEDDDDEDETADFSEASLEDLLGISTEQIRKNLDQEDWDESEDDEKVHVRFILIGSVLNLVPSGKYYAPWSTGVTEEERQMDQAWLERVNELLEEQKWFLSSGEGDALDLFIGEVKEQDG